MVFLILLLKKNKVGVEQEVDLGHVSDIDAGNRTQVF